MNSPYNGKFKISQNYKPGVHNGIDIWGIDSKEIHATINGTVEIARWENSRNKKQGFGKYVMIHEDNGDRCFIYGHLSEILVEVGQHVNNGDVIGIEGTTGNSTGNHCHYEVRNGSIIGNALDINEISGIPNDEGGIYDDGYRPSVENTKPEEKKDNREYHTLYNMYVRCGAGYGYGTKLYKDLTEDGKRNALDKYDYNYAIYKKGTVFTALEVITNNDGSVWAKTPSGYVVIKGASGTVYCEKL